MIKTYIVNLATSTTRREYMQNLLKPYQFLDIQFIEAIDGRKFQPEELDDIFDNRNGLLYYGRQLNAGEKGCTLSHRKCYKSLLDSNEEYALILEDDIHPKRTLEELKTFNLKQLMQTETPTILLLSGNFWYTKLRENLATVYDAGGSYAYMINRAAANIIIGFDRPYNVADDWDLFKRNGIKIYAIKPYLIDANMDMELLKSDIEQNEWGSNKRKMTLSHAIRSYYRGLIKRILKYNGKYEAKTLIVGNKIVEK